MVFHIYLIFRVIIYFSANGCLGKELRLGSKFQGFWVMKVIPEQLWRTTNALYLNVFYNLEL